MAGFFGTHGSFSSGSGGDFEVAEEGVYTCNLAEVKTEKRAKYDDPTVEEDVFFFAWETTTARDSKGNPFRFVKFTGTKYGNEKANLTLTIDAMLGRHLTQDEFFALDLDALKARPYKLMVTEHTTQSGKIVNKIVSIKSADAKTGQAKPATTMGQMATGGRKPPLPEDDDDLSDANDPFKD